MMARMRSQSPGATSSAGWPPANQPIGTAIPDGTTELDLSAGFDAGAVEHHRAGGDPGAALDHASGQVRVRADQRGVTDAGFLARHAPDDRVLHDHAVRPDLHGAALGGDHGAEQHPAVRADGDVAGQHRRRRDIGRLRHLRALQPVLHEHRTTPHHRRRNQIFVRSHIHHLTPLAVEHTGRRRPGLASGRRQPDGGRKRRRDGIGLERLEHQRLEHQGRARGHDR
jgi:hypothetical protein